jgi:hypothetical protein
MKRYRRPSEKKLSATRPSKFSRRGFIAGSAATIAAVAVTPSTILADPARATNAAPGAPRLENVAEAAPLQPAETRTLVRFVRDLFPHDRLDDSFYLRAIAPLSDEAAVDRRKRFLLAQGITNLDALAKAANGKPYADVADENIRVTVIKKIEGTPFFTEVYGASIVGLYNQPELWSKFGYEGPSSAQGGYLHRGFDDIDWL